MISAAILRLRHAPAAPALLAGGKMAIFIPKIIAFGFQFCG